MATLIQLVDFLREWTGGSGDHCASPIRPARPPTKSTSTDIVCGQFRRTTRRPLTDSPHRNFADDRILLLPRAEDGRVLGAARSRRAAPSFPHGSRTAKISARFASATATPTTSRLTPRRLLCFDSAGMDWGASFIADPRLPCHPARTGLPRRQPPMAYLLRRQPSAGRDHRQSSAHGVPSHRREIFPANTRRLFTSLDWTLWPPDRDPPQSDCSSTTGTWENFNRAQIAARRSWKNAAKSHHCSSQRRARSNFNQSSGAPPGLPCTRFLHRQGIDPHRSIRKFGRPPPAARALRHSSKPSRTGQDAVAIETPGRRWASTIDSSAT